MKEYIQIVNDNLMYHKSDGTVIKLLPTIEDIMSADSVDRPQGEWIVRQPKPFFLCTCSVCGETEEFMTKYCPNCGARMKGVEDE